MASEPQIEIKDGENVFKVRLISVPEYQIAKGKHRKLYGRFMVRATHNRMPWSLKKEELTSREEN